MLKDWRDSQQIFASTGVRSGAESFSYDYELLFASAGEPVLIVHAASSRILEINPSATRLLQACGAPLLEARLESVFHQSSSGTIKKALSSVQAQEHTEAVEVRSFDGAPMRLSVSLLRAHSRTYFLIRLDPHAATAKFRPNFESVVFQAIESAKFGFVLTDANFQIDYANRWFIATAGEKSFSHLSEKSLLQWLDLAQTDLSNLRTQLLQRQAVTHVTTMLRTPHHSPRAVEIHAVCVPRGEETCWGFSIRELPRVN